MKKLFFIPLLIALFSFHFATGQKSNIIKTNSGTIHYVTFGSGEPLLIINGGPGMNCNGFSSLATLLDDNFRVILYDQRGTGKSELTVVDSTTLSMDLLVEDLETLREHLRVEKWFVLGHSFGGFVAQHYASKHEKRLKGMILSGSGGIDLEIFSYLGANMHIRMSDLERDSLAYWNNKIRKGDTTYHAKYNAGKFRAPVYLYERKHIDRIAHRLTQANPEIGGLMFKDLSKNNYDWSISMSKLKTPVLIIQGQQDLVGSETAYKAHNIYKYSKLVLLNKCGHYGWLEQEEKYIREVKSFIDDLI
ncbi:alpha/beta fold hydrolase [Reichenbachiella versicolor]|uniref:alpha/beta fold hydrolase n=1 Tax=Reichenbachiella versicolor TaxID=1821036 RepID=UPI000D6DE5A3|nr:alpha/beta hydrolase [Reichenbachiella versicolor]